MYMTFDRYRFLNGTAVATRDVRYSAYLDKEALDPNLIFAAAPVRVGRDAFVTLKLPAQVPGVRSVKIWATVEVAAGRDAKLENWVVTSDWETDDSLREVEVTVEPTQVADTFVATALLIFEDMTYERKTRFFAV